MTAGAGAAAAAVGAPAAAVAPELIDLSTAARDAQLSDHVIPVSVVTSIDHEVAQALIIPVCVIGAPLVLLPAGGASVIGATLASPATRAVTEARAIALAETALGFALQEGESFLGGVRGDHHVTIALCARQCAAPLICIAPDAIAQRVSAYGPRARCWCTLDALANDARYELAAEAIARTLAFVSPQRPRSLSLRSGVAGDATFTLHAADGAAMGADTFSERLDRATSAVTSLLDALDRAACDSRYSPHQQECFVNWRAAIRLPPAEEVPHAMRSKAPELPTEALTDLPFEHRAAPPSTAPLPEPRPPPDVPPELRSIKAASALFLPELKGYSKIRRMLRRLSKWHRLAKAGMRARRPPPLALDVSSLVPPARAFVEAGGIIDTRDPSCIRFLDPREQPFPSHLHRDAIDAELASCPDQELRCMIHGGVVLKAGVRPQIVIMPNLNSLYQGDEGVAVDAVVDELYSLVDRGWYSTHTFIPFIPWRCAPRGAVARPGGGVPRGIVDNGAPRNALHTWPRGEPVVSVNQASGPMRPPHGTEPSGIKWHQEHKPLFKHACRNGLILWNIARAAGQPLFVFAFDFKYYFHQLYLRYGEWWLAGSVMPARLRQDGVPDTLVTIVEMVLSMGTSPSSQIAQRFANAMLWALFRRMDAAEVDAAAAEAEPAAVRAWLARRERLPHDGYGTQARLYDALMFTDDPIFHVIGVERAIRLLATWHGMVGPDGFNLMYAKAAKWQGGVHAKWLGCTTAPMLEAAWLTPDKSLAILSRLDSLANQTLRVSDHGKLVGQLEHFRFMAQLPGWTMYGIRDAARSADGTALPPGATARYAGRVVHAVAKWRRAAASAPGVWLLASAPAATRTRAASLQASAGAAEWHLFSDAALTGTASPGLGGYMHGVWWCLPLDHLLMRLPIVVLELLAAVLNIIIFAAELRSAPRAVLEVDALSAQLVLRAGRAHSADLQVVHEEMLLLPEFRRIRHRLVVRHTYGEANPAADAASRGKHDFLRALCDRLGVRQRQRELPHQALEFVARVCERLGAGSRPQPRVGGRFGMDPAAVREITARSVPRDAPELPREMLARGRTSSSTDYDGPPLVSIRKRALVRLADPALAAAPIPAMPTSAPAAGTTSPLLRLPVGGPSMGALGPTSGTEVAAPPCLARRRTSVSNLAIRESTHQLVRGAGALSISSGTGGSVDVATSSRLRTDVARAADMLGLSAARVERMSRAAEGRAIQIVHAVQSDTSRWRLRPADDGELLAIARLLSAELESAAPANTLSNESSNWTHWEAWCSHMGTAPLRNDRAANSGADEVGYERETLLLAAALPFIHRRMRRRPGWRTPPSPLSALQVLRGVRRVHKRLGTPMVPLTMAVVLVNRLLDNYVRLHGHDALQPKRKEPLTNPIICAMLSLPQGTPVGKRRVDWSQLEWIALRAMYATLAQTGMRKSEVALPADDPFGKRHLSRAALAWRIGGRFVVSPTPEQLQCLSDGDYALLTVAPSKADQFGLIWSPAPIVLPYHADAREHPICAARELAGLELAWPLHGEQRRAAPLFVDGQRRPLRHKHVDSTFQDMLLAAGVSPEQASTLSMHSWRIYLACALLAAGASTSQILSMLRWRSDEALRLYARLNDSDYATWLDAAADATIDSIRTSNVVTLAEAAAAQEHREWLRKAAQAHERLFDPTATPQHTHDDAVAEMLGAANGLAAAAATYDAQDAT